MCNSGINTIDNFIADLGNSLANWTSYLASVKRGPILQESAIRYAVSEFLEVSKHCDGVTPVIEHYHFEQDHPYYKGKRSDLFFRASIPDVTSKSFIDPNNPDNPPVTVGTTKEVNMKKEPKEFSIEFKYIREEAAQPKGDEYKRYIKDLCRLFCISKNEKTLAKCYFVVVGEYFPFYAYFYQIPKTDYASKSDTNTNIEKVESLTHEAQGQYVELFPFALEKCKKVELDDYDFIVKAIEDANKPRTNDSDTSFFKRRLDGRSGINFLRTNAEPPKSKLSEGDLHFVELGDSLTLRLVYSNMPPEYPQKIHPNTIVCIWEVSSE